ncbi:hypothetical protein CRUP_006141, partial [Coryphaenoides rupestris]
MLGAVVPDYEQLKDPHYERISGLEALHSVPTSFCEVEQEEEEEKEEEEEEEEEQEGEEQQDGEVLLGLLVPASRGGLALWRSWGKEFCTFLHSSWLTRVWRRLCSRAQEENLVLHSGQHRLADIARATLLSPRLRQCTSEVTGTSEKRPRWRESVASLASMSHRMLRTSCRSACRVIPLMFKMADTCFFLRPRPAIFFLILEEALKTHLFKLTCQSPTLPSFKQALKTHLFKLT